MKFFQYFEVLEKLIRMIGQVQKNHLPDQRLL